MPITAPDGRVLFTDDELRCKGSGLLRLAQGFAQHLRELRLEFGRPMVVTSCCRSHEHNRRVGGHPHSLHVCDRPHWPTGGAAAIDIACHDPAERARLARLALNLGWSVGVAGTFVHLDRRGEYTPRPQAVFLY